MNNKDFISDQKDIRIDLYLSNVLTSHSRSYINDLIGKGNILVNGSTTKPSYKLKLADRISVFVPEPVVTEMAPESIALDVVYEDEYLIVVNKPQGMVVHPAPGHHSGTLAHALLHHCEGSLSDINGVIRPGIIHRIDKDTSGLIIAVKDNDTHRKMAEAIAAHDIERTYRTCVYGVLDSDKGIIDAPISRSPSDRKKMAVVSGGKHAVSRFEVIKRFRKATDLVVRLETGRTHQIRVHMHYIGHPVIGDPLYAHKRKVYSLSGQALHSSSLSFVHPHSGETINLSCPLPDYYLQLLDDLDAE